MPAAKAVWHGEVRMKRKSLVLLFVIVFGFFASIGLFCRTLTIGYNSDAEYEPAWSPDGSKIAFIGETYSGSHLYVMDADGSNIVQLAELGGELSFCLESCLQDQSGRDEKGPERN